MSPFHPDLPRPIAEVRVTWEINFMLHHFVASILCAVLLQSCGQSEKQGGEVPDVPMAQPYAGDPENFTSGGFPKHAYHAQGCGSEIALKPPFQVSEDGWGQAEIRAPLILLTNPNTVETAPEGVDGQNRLSFAFPSRFGGLGLKEEFALGVRAGNPPPRPLEAAPSTLASADALIGDGTRGYTQFFGRLGGREIALACTPVDLPNPICRAEIEIGPNGNRYLAVFPPKQVGSLAQIVEIGNDLFARTAATCKAIE
jgi:hypothetical protein